MKAITLWQPWASLIAEGLKQYETRSFKIKHRGKLAIHAAKTRKGMDVYRREGYHLTEPSMDLIHLPFGKVVCVVELVFIRQTHELRSMITPLERTLGDWTPGRYAWSLKLIKKFKEPIPAIGRQGLWNIDTKLLIKEFKP